LVQEVLDEASDDLQKGSALVLDSHSKDLIDNISGYELKEFYSIRIHKSMTRHIAVLIKL